MCVYQIPMEDVYVCDAVVASAGRGSQDCYLGRMCVRHDFKSYWNAPLSLCSPLRVNVLSNTTSISILKRHGVSRQSCSRASQGFIILLSGTTLYLSCHIRCERRREKQGGNACVFTCALSGIVKILTSYICKCRGAVHFVAMFFVMVDCCLQVVVSC